MEERSPQNLAGEFESLEEIIKKLKVLKVYKEQTKLKLQEAKSQRRNMDERRSSSRRKADEYIDKYTEQSKAIIEDEKKTLQTYQQLLDESINIPADTNGNLVSPLPDFTESARTRYTLYNIVSEDNYEVCAKLIKKQTTPFPL